MTENKQFKLSKPYGIRYIESVKSCSTYISDNDKFLSYGELVDLLNELDTMNKFLGTENNQIYDELKTRTSLQHQLEEENQKLRNEINMLKVTIARNESYIDRLTHQSDWGISAVKKGFNVWEQEPVDTPSTSITIPVGARKTNTPLREKL